MCLCSAGPVVCVAIERRGVSPLPLRMYVVVASPVVVVYAIVNHTVVLSHGTAQVIVGCAARAAGKESTPVAYEVTFPAGTTAFVVDAPKGSVPAGGSQKVSVGNLAASSSPPR